MKTFTEDEFDSASYALSQDIQLARETHDRNLICRIRQLWQYDAFGRGSRHGDSWASILQKVDVEGSAWIVWWYDGVRVYLRRARRQRVRLRLEWRDV